MVRARAGDRARYEPIVTPLAATSDAVDVARGLLGAAQARRLYIADLDAITGTGSNHGAIRRIFQACPGVELWIDSGIGTTAAAQDLLRERLGRIVIGSESQADPSLLSALGPDAILSLDFRGESFLGPAALRDDPSLWPPDVIIMTLARVGTGTGPDLARLAAARSAAPSARICAAGGLRGHQDLAALVQVGVAGVLVASALHDGRLVAAPAG